MTISAVTAFIRRTWVRTLDKQSTRTNRSQGKQPCLYCQPAELQHSGWKGAPQAALLSWCNVFSSGSVKGGSMHEHQEALMKLTSQKYKGFESSLSPSLFKPEEICSNEYSTYDLWSCQVFDQVSLSTCLEPARLRIKEFSSYNYLLSPLLFPYLFICESLQRVRSQQCLWRSNIN